MSFLSFEMDVTPAVDHLEQTRQSILGGIREAIDQGMHQLAEDVAAKLHGDPINTRTGDLLDAVLRSPRVFSTDTAIIGEVTTQSAKWRNKGLWLEFGTHMPTKGRGLPMYPRQFLLTRSAVSGSGYRIEPKPFFNPTAQADFPTIIDNIQAKIAEATDGVQ